MNRNIGLGLILIAATSLGVGLYQLNRNTLQQVNSPNTSEKSPDSFIIQAQNIEFDTHGQLHSVLTAHDVKHYPQQKITRYIQPNFTIYTNRRIPWHVTARYGIGTDNNKMVYLKGHVVIHQPNQPTNPETTIKTSHLTIFPMLSQAKTDAKAVIIRPNSTVYGKGLTANLKSGNYRLLSQSQGSYEPPQPTQSIH